MSTSVDILREQGPMTLRELTGETAKRLNARLRYEDVAAVLAIEQMEGKVEHTDASDFRDRVWSVKA